MSKKITIDSFRIGYATNSSSSHSIVFLKTPSGRNEFIDHIEDIVSYLEGCTDRNTLAEIKSYLEKSEKLGLNEMIKFFVTDSYDYHMDNLYEKDIVAYHLDFGGDTHEIPSEEVELYKFVIDNHDKDFAFKTITKEYPSTYKIRKDGKWFSVFNIYHYEDYKNSLPNADPAVGSESMAIVFRFSLEPNPGKYVKARYPELVDIKITDYCPFGCKFCYQASTEKGVHASMDTIEKIAKMLKKMGVFEVALGGGEPTEHPRFIDILQIFHDHDIVVNFTTYSDKWTKDAPFVWRVGELCSGIGVSVHGFKDLEKYHMISEAMCRYDTKIVPHLVVGAIPISRTIELVDVLFHKYKAPTVLLLGFKNVGRGKDYPRHNKQVSEDDIRMLLDIFYSDRPANFMYKPTYGDYRQKCFFISVDTAFAKNFENILEERGVDPRLYNTDEGKFSCYIDAVNGYVGKSSYQPETFVRMNSLTVEEFERIWTAW